MRTLETAEAPPTPAADAERAALARRFAAVSRAPTKGQWRSADSAVLYLHLPPPAADTLAGLGRELHGLAVRRHLAVWLPDWRRQPAEFLPPEWRALRAAECERSAFVGRHAAALRVMTGLCGWAERGRPRPEELLADWRAVRACEVAMLACHGGLIGQAVGRQTVRGADRDDLQQELALHSLDCLGRFDPRRGVRFSTLATLALERRARQHYRDWLRRRRHEPPGLGDGLRGAAPDERAADFLALGKLRRLLRTNLLTRGERQALDALLDGWGGGKRLALACGCSRQAISKRIAVALAKLRTWLEEPPGCGAGSGSQTCTR